MKRVLLLLLIALGTIATPALAAEDVFLLGFTGYDYEDANTDTGTYLAVGDGYKTLGFVVEFGAYLTSCVDVSANEYTYAYSDLTVQSRFSDGDLLEVVFANPGRARFYADSRTTGTAAQYGTAPPNATAPSTFTDGTLILGGRIDNMVLTYDYGDASGSFVGDVTFDEGSCLEFIPVAQRSGWTLAGNAGPPNESVPPGYDHQVSGECRIPGPVPARQQTWGALKALYR